MFFKSSYVSGGFFARSAIWLFVLTLCFGCSTCTRELFEKLTFYGYVYDIHDHKPMPNTRVLINSCCGKVSGGCNFCLIAVAFTNADGYYAIARRAAKSDRYFFNFESETFSNINENPVGSQFEIKYTGPDKNFRNDFTIGHVRYWHKVHVKNITPIDSNDRLVMHMPFASGHDFRDTLVFKGTKVDTSIVINMTFATCCTDNPLSQSGTAVYSCDRIKDNTYNYIVVDKGIQPRDTTFYEILY